LWIRGLTFTRPVLECGYIALYSFEGALCAFDVLFVGVPICCFFGEAGVVDGLVCHCVSEYLVRLMDQDSGTHRGGMDVCGGVAGYLGTFGYA
jgi:hypothetical protein